ncbi:MAG: hypothetical protein H7311_09450 [Ramlibacter sp.]|nr:hypothetical protein [Cryobacterium sp.]
MSERYPVIYVRGFAGGQNAMDVAADDPFYGFNEGSTHVRVGAGGQPRFYQYEGPLLRLVRDQQYRIEVGGSQQNILINAAAGSLEPNSVWIYRFYDASSGTFGVEPQPYDIGRAARGLVDFIDLVRSKTRGGPPVYLVAHSMGGLICRAALQRELVDPAGAVSKLCTIGTPHGGISPELGGPIGGWIMDRFGPLGSDIFAPRRMQEYLLPAGHDPDRETDPKTGRWDPRRLVGTFPASRVLSIVGTNSRDYAVAAGLSSAVMGMQSDGLVAIRNAYVYGAARAYIHRSHSGRYGLVNSEETYQNLSRFLFGGLRVEVGLHGVELDRKDRIWQGEARLAIRGVPVLIHEQTADHYCPIDLNAAAQGIAGPLSPVPLMTIFLQPKNVRKCRYALDLKVSSLKETGGILGFGDHLEQIADWQDTLIVDVEVNDTGVARSVTWEWNSALAGRIAEQAQLPHQLDWAPGKSAGGQWQLPVPIAPMGQAVLGTDARLQLDISLWA